jgi:hypothetical protein
MPEPVYLEEGRRRVFAVAVDWPGWARSAKTPAEALESLWDRRGRYGSVLGGLWNPGGELEVVETLAGGTTTDFGAPGEVPELDRVAVDASEIDRLTAIWRRCWEAFDAVAESAPPTLRKGPRGGGRDTAQVVDHVVQADAAYARQIGVSTRGLDPEGVRKASLARATSLGRSPEQTKWPVRYLIRRSAWHVLDHLWEIEDKSE